MKNAIIMLSVAVCILSFAVTAAADGDSGKLTATVNNVTPAMSAGEHSSISVIDEYGGPVKFDVTPATAITGSIDEPIKINDIHQNDTVEIEYTNLSGGFGIAKSIKRTNE